MAMNYQYGEQCDQLRKQLRLLKEQHDRTRKLLRQYREAKLEQDRTTKRVNNLRTVCAKLHPVHDKVGHCFLDEENEGMVDYLIGSAKIDPSAPPGEPQFKDAAGNIVGKVAFES